MLNNNFSVNEKGRLTLSGVDTVELAGRYGTPLYVLDENDIRNNCRQFKNAFDKYYGGNARVYYASKALSCKEMYRIVNDEGLYTDVVSGGELYTALSVGFPAENYDALVAYVNAHPETLLVVTADHETGGTAVGYNSYPVGGTSPVKLTFSTKGHTGTVVPIFAYGTGAENFAGIFKNREIPGIIESLMK